MPNPRAFLETASRRLREGTNLVLRFPEKASTGFWEALEDSARAFDLWMHPVESDIGPVAPLEYMKRYCAGGPREVFDCLDLATHDGFHGVTRFEFSERGPGQEWTRFLEEFRRASRGRSPGSGVVCLLLEGRGTEVQGLRAEVGLEIMSWDGVSTLLDMRCYAAVLMRRRQSSSVLEHELMVEMVAQLALQDPSLAEQLARCTLEALQDPLDVLHQYGVEAGWASESEAKWEKGSAGKVGDRRVLHSSWLALQGCDLDLKRRIWRGQASVLLPWLEECRAEFVEALRPAMMMPWRHERRDGQLRVIDAVEQMELRDIWDFLGVQGSHKLEPARKAVRQLVDLRNRLSHFSNESVLSGSVEFLPEQERRCAEAVESCRRWAGVKTMAAG